MYVNNNNYMYIDNVPIAATSQLVVSQEDKRCSPVVGAWDTLYKYNYLRYYQRYRVKQI